VLKTDSSSSMIMEQEDEEEKGNEKGNENEMKSRCFGCRLGFTDEMESQRFQCQKCSKVFCLDCDLFIHDHLHNCPGCLQLDSDNNVT